MLYSLNFISVFYTRIRDTILFDSVANVQHFDEIKLLLLPKIQDYYYPCC